jgi:hypothetical protein
MNPLITGSGGGVVSPLLTGLISAWRMSADGTDSHGTNTLTNNNTVTFVAGGKSGNAAYSGNISATPRYLSRTGLSLSGDWSIAMWFKYTAIATGDVNFLVTDDAAFAGTSFNLTAPDTVFSVYGDNFTNVTIAGLPTANVWHLAVCAFDFATKMGKLSIDGAAYVDGNGPVTSGWGAQSTIKLMQSYASGGSDELLLDEVSLWSKVLSAEEVTSLYNAGAGLFYPFS